MIDYNWFKLMLEAKPGPIEINDIFWANISSFFHSFLCDDKCTWTNFKLTLAYSH